MCLEMLLHKDHGNTTDNSLEKVAQMETFVKKTN